MLHYENKLRFGIVIIKHLISYIYRENYVTAQVMRNMRRKEICHG